MIYVDLDGVLVDLVRGVCEEFDVPVPENPTWDLDELGIPNLWERVENLPASFWAFLPKTEDCDALLAALPSDYRLLTKPMETPESWIGKVRWVRRELGKEGLKRLILARDKHLLAGDGVGGGSILIDDLEMNIYEWVKAGGTGILWPASWNDSTEKKSEILAFLARLKNVQG